MKEHLLWWCSWFLWCHKLQWFLILLPVLMNIVVNPDSCKRFNFTKLLVCICILRCNALSQIVEEYLYNGKSSHKKIGAATNDGVLAQEHWIPCIKCVVCKTYMCTLSAWTTYNQFSTMTYQTLVVKDTSIVNKWWKCKCWASISLLYNIYIAQFIV